MLIFFNSTEALVSWKKIYILNLEDLQEIIFQYLSSDMLIKERKIL
jgi:hypothetical protein